MRDSTTLTAAERTPTAVPAEVSSGRSRRRRSLLAGLTLLGTATAAAVAAVALSLSGPAGTGHAAFAIQRVSGTTVSVHIVSTAAEAGEMTAQLQEKGLDVTVDTIPASPQLVGTWLTASFSEDVPEPVVERVLAQVPNGYTTTVELPVTFDGEIRLGVGRAPAAGEELQVLGMRNALAPGARLGCLHATGGEPARVQQAAEQLGYTVTWADGDTPELITVPGAGAGRRTAAAFIDDARPGEVRLVAATPGSRRYDGRSRMGYSPAQWQTRESNPGACMPA